jgi:hypothetical protein
MSIRSSAPILFVLAATSALSAQRFESASSSRGAESGSPAADQRVIATRSLRPFVHRTGSVRWGLRSMLPLATPEMTSFEGMQPSENTLSPDQVTSLLAMANDDYDEDRLRMNVDRSTLLLAGAPEVLERMGRRILELENTIARSIEVEASVHVLDDATDIPGQERAFLSSEEWRQFSERFPAERTVRGATISGGLLSLSSGGARPLVLDLDVEVAQDASISDPQVQRVPTGLRLKIEPHLTASGGRTPDVVARVELAYHDIISLQRQVLGAPGLGAIDTPEIATFAAMFATRLGRGETAVVYARRATAPARHFAIALRCTVREIQEVGPDDFVVVPVGSLGIDSPGGGGARLFIADELSRDQGDVERVFYSGENLDVYGAIEPGLLTDLVSLEDFEGDENLVPGWMLMAGGGARSVAALRQERLASLEQRLLRPIAIEVLVNSGRGDEDVRVRVPSLVGRDAAVRFGVDRLVVDDFEVEIAQEAEQANPVTHGEFDGVLFAASIDELGESGTHWATLIGHRVQLPPERQSLEDEHLGSLLMAPARFSAQEFSGFAPGRRLELGSGAEIPARGQDVRTTLSLEAVEIGGSGTRQPR